MTGTAAPGARRWVLGLFLALSFLLRLWYSSADLDSSRFFDERYSFHNIQAHLVHERREPANAYYPSLSYLPQLLVLAAADGLHRATGHPVLAIRQEGVEPWTPTAYRLCRGVSALYGALALYWVYRLGRRGWSPGVGLAAAVIAGAVPHHLYSSAMFKPDILVVWLTLVAAELAQVALARPGLRRFLLAGVGVGLAVAAKYTGVGAALPLTAGALAGGAGWRRRWGLLTLAGGASVLTFLALNPWIGATLSFLPKLAGIYEQKGEQAGGSHLGMLLEEAGFLWRHHGAVVFLLALLGLGMLVPRAVAALRRGGERWAELAVVAFVTGYSLLYAAATTLFKGQNYLPVASFTALAAAVGAREVAARLGRWRPALARRPVAVPALLLVTAALYTAPVTRVYREVVPTTTTLAARALARELAPAHQRLVVTEGEQPLAVWGGAGRAAAVAVPDLRAVPAETLDRADAEVFPAARLQGSAAETYLRRLAGAPGTRPLRFDPAPFSARGEPLAVAVHPWAPRGAVELALAPTDLAGALSAAPEGAEPGIAGRGVTASLVVELANPPAGAPKPIAVLAGRTLPLDRVERRGRRSSYLSPRFELPATAPPWTLEVTPITYTAGVPVTGRLHLWAPPGASPDPAVHSRR
jgi:4-amino-4-deoxy-L-arabinose transferase-like glycosyltransferase